jgi:hypothetical protein
MESVADVTTPRSGEITWTEGTPRSLPSHKKRDFATTSFKVENGPSKSPRITPSRISTPGQEPFSASSRRSYSVVPDGVEVVDLTG